MDSRKTAWKIKRVLAGLLTVGIILTGMPVFAVQAASESMEQPREEEETTGAEDFGTGGETVSGNGKEPDTENDRPGNGESSTETDKPDERENGLDNGEDSSEKEETADGEEDSDTDKPDNEDDDADETASVEASRYHVQVSGNDISGNDLNAYDEEEEEDFLFIPGYIELPEERNMSVVDESLPMDYGDGISRQAEEEPPAKWEPAVGELPKTRNQNPYGSCWAHSAMALAEIDMVKNGGMDTSVDYSELHLAYFSYNYNENTVQDPLHGLDGDSNAAYYTEDYPNYLQRGGSLGLAQNVLTSWVGAADEKTAPYETAKEAIENGLPSETAFQDMVHLQNYYNVDIKENPKTAKQLIMEYGALGTSYYESELYYDSGNKSYYCNDRSSTNHAVTIVGWDDDFAAFDNLDKKPEAPGAWLIRNSWAAGQDVDSRGRATYFWLSYEDTSLKSGYAFDFEPADNYDHNYQYDGCMSGGTYTFPYAKTRVANVFTAKGCETGEQLQAVGVAIGQAQMPYTIYIYKNPQPGNPDQGTLVTSQSGINLCEGFYTVPLEEPVELASGETFSVVVEFAPSRNASKTEIVVPCEMSSSSTSAVYRCIASANEEESFYKNMMQAGQEGKEDKWFAWHDVGAEKQFNFRIKAYTADRKEALRPVGTIIYELDGGINASNNPVSYDVVTNFELEDPTKEGYTFEGWYTDSEYNDRIFYISGSELSGNLTLYAKWRKNVVELQEESVTFRDNPEPKLTYNGTEQKPEVVVMVDGKALTEGTDYTLSYQNNKNASTDTAKASVTVTAKGDDYSGTIRKEFVIGKASLTITAKDLTIQEGESVSAKYDYQVEGLMEGDSVTTPPSYRCTVANDDIGEHFDAIEPYGARIGNGEDPDQDNYDIE